MNSADKPPYPARLAPLVALRPHQWTKNGVVMAAFLFALGDTQQQIGMPEFWKGLLAVLFFCLGSSAVYLMNDSRDRELDRLHPTKRFRPIAAGLVSVRTAIILSMLLLVVSFVCGWFLAPAYLAVLAGYVLMQILYTFFLKKIPLVDVIVIALGFLLRAVAGAVAIGVVISSWLLLCTFLLALFLGLSKRRHEKVVLAHLDGVSRPGLDKTSGKLLDRLILGVSIAAVLAYGIYTIYPDTVAKFGSHKLAFTIPWVVLGFCRYFYLVYRKEEGGRPEKVLLTDLPMIGILLGYGATLMWLFL